MRRTSRIALVGATALSLGTTLALTTASPASAGLSASPAPVRHLMKTLGSVGGLQENRLPLVGGAPAGLPLSYHSGDVELTNTNYAIFWEPAGHPSSPTYQTLIKRWFADVGGSALFNTTTEYYQTTQGPQQNIQNVSTFGGSYVDTTPFPAGGITDADVQAAVARAVANNPGWTVGIGHEFFVYSGPGGEVVSSYCAYHGSFTLNGATALYADEPYGGQSGCTVPSSPNGDPAADSAINTTSHEQWETITDPVSGWYALDGDEGSDQCNFQFGTTNANGADVVLHGHGYIVQQEWRNSLAPFGCVMS